MAEPIGPEAYLAIASSLQNAINSYRNKNRTKQNDKITNISTDSSKSSLTLPADELLSHAGLKFGNDGYGLWAIDSPAHPRNWSRQRKAYDFGLILFLEFFMSGINAGGTSASFAGAEVLGQTREVGLVAFTTMYLLGQALGSLLLSPYSDRFGRRTQYIGSAFLYSVFCLPVAATSNIAGVFAGRFITGVISAVPAMATPLSIEDLFETEGRMWAFFSWALVTNLGLVIGPIYASYVAASLNWRWPFYLATIIVAVTGILMSFIRESQPSRLLERTVAAIQPHRAGLILRTAPTAPRPSVFQPLILLFTRPNIFLSSLANAFSTALLYLFAVAFPLIYANYGWNRQNSTLIFLFVALGLFFSTLTRFHDRHTTRNYHLTNRHLGPQTPLFGLAIGAPALAVGLWWFAWTIPGSHVKTGISWPASALSLVPIGYAINEHSTVLPRYVLDSPPQSQSHKSNNNNNAAFTALLTTKALLAALFPLFTQHMFETLGANTAGSVLASIATAFYLIPLILTYLGVGGRGSSTSGDDPLDGAAGSAQDFEKKEEKRKERKTVRWDDETDSDLSKKSRSEDLRGGESMDTAEMEMESKGAGVIDVEMEMEMENENVVSETSRVGTEKSESGRSDAEAELSKVEKEGWSRTLDSSGDDGSADSCKQKEKGEKEKEDKKKKEKKEDEKKENDVKKKQEKGEKEEKEGKEKARLDDGDDGVAGFLGVDLERVAVFPYF